MPMSTAPRSSGGAPKGRPVSPKAMRTLSTITYDRPKVRSSGSSMPRP